MEDQTSSRHETEVLPFPSQKQEVKRDNSKAILLISLWSDILNARLLAVLALVGALFLWGFTIYDPTVLRLWASGLYSLVLWPVVYLYSKKGE